MIPKIVQVIKINTHNIIYTYCLILIDTDEKDQGCFHHYAAGNENFQFPSVFRSELGLNNWMAVILTAFKQRVTT